MKSIQVEKNNWKKINKVVLRVDNIHLIFGDNLIINFDCGFENISRGRCKLSVEEKKSKSANNLFIHSDKALMEINLFYDVLKLDKLLMHFSLKKNTTKKIKISIKTLDSLMINDQGDLYVRDMTKIRIESISWNIPLL